MKACGRMRRQRGEEMSAERKELQRTLYHYVRDALTNINTVKTFCDKSSRWINKRQGEFNMMTDIKDRDDKGGKEAELDQELTAVVEETLRGLKELDHFLDAVEKLAVTSHHVFTENQVMSLPTGINKENVQVVIITARLICPLLLEFKRDAEAFFKPKRQNIEVLMNQLDRYIKTTETICGQLEKSFFSDFDPMETVLNPEVDLSVDDINKMLHHINQLDEIRRNQPFRMVFLFQEVPCSDFINEFEKRQPRMLQFLNELEECAVQLDRMNKGAKISSVAGSSVGIVGGILSIVGLALIPVTAGVSVALTMTGIGLGITSGVNSAVTTATEVGVNKTQQKKASEAFKSFMEDVQSLLVHLENVTNQTFSKMEAYGSDVAVGVGKIVLKVGTIGKNVDALVDAASAVKLLNLSKSARALSIGLSALFIGVDVIFICIDGVNLAKGSETKVSQFIRARAALWSSEMNSWQKIHDSLCQGLKTSEEHKAVLKTPFYPHREI